MAGVPSSGGVIAGSDNQGIRKESLSKGRGTGLLALSLVLVAAGMTASRLLHRHTGDHWRNKAVELGKEPADLAFAPVIKKLHDRANWELVPEASWAKDKAGVLDSYWLQGSTFPRAPEQNQMGICLSGGGIRSATVALGALQVLQDQQLGRYLGEQAVKILVDCSGSGPVDGGS
ncbi:MAG TPA: hypothetical protein VFJ07_03520 [Streptosporangiaceae bacterium]|nr:hypothetical protein [Streptosporangiaceae bacterium]